MKHARGCAALLLTLVLSMGITGVASGAEADRLKDVKLSEDALYNGIVIPSDFDYANDFLDPEPVEIPYLLSEAEGGYHPEVVNIDVGRQLFVDDFLIQSTTLDQTYHQAKTYSKPVFSVENTKTGNGAPANSGGVWYDMDEKVYKLWYSLGFCQTTGYAVSQDGVNWEIPENVGINGGLAVNTQQSDSTTVWLDYNAPKNERYKMMIRSRDGRTADGEYITENPATLYTSHNGIVWFKKGQTGLLGDRSTFFYNPFTEEWVYSVRMVNRPSAWGNDFNTRRTRFYHAGEDWYKASQWSWDDSSAPTFWQKTDNADPIDQTQGNNIPQLYNFDSIAYESIMLGMFDIWYGPHNDVAYARGLPKITELQASYSRDGFHYSRPVRGAGNALIPASRKIGDWDYGYLQSTTGGMIVYDDEIRIYYTAFSGQYTDQNGETRYGADAGGAVGLASLRRDGFASMDGSGSLTTVPLTVTKSVKYLFVNANTANGSLKAEVLDTDGNVVEGFSAEDCEAMVADDCCYQLSWRNGKSLSFLRGKSFRIRFVMENGELYSFWLSADPEGASGGAVGAGYAGAKDLNPTIAEDPEELPTDSGEGEPARKKGCGSVLGTLPVIAVLSAAAYAVGKRKKRA